MRWRVRVPDDPKQPPKQALPLAEAVRKLGPELAWRQHERLPPEERATADRYFGGPVHPQTAVLVALREGEALSWGREGRLGGDMLALPPAIWPRLWCIDWDLGLASDEVIDDDGISRPSTLQFWDVRVALAEQPEAPDVSTIAAEKRCAAWLAGLMREVSQPPFAKQYYLEAARQRFGVSDRAFVRAWNDAIKETGNPNWRRPGRKPSKS